MPSLSDTDVKLKFTTTADTKGADQAAAAVKNVGDAGDKAAGNSGGGGGLGALNKMATVAKVAVAALGVAAFAATKNFVEQAASFQQTRIGLENMLGSADAARNMLSQISDFAAATPFEFPELADATRQLVAFGFSGEDAFKTMKQLGDVSAAIGAPIGDLSYLMGTLRSQGRAFTVDIRQFAQRGIPIYEYLGSTLHKTTAEVNEMIEAGKIGFPEVAKAFDAMTSQGGKFFQTMDKQSHSLSGQWSTLTDNIGFMGKALVGINKQGDVKDGSLFDGLTKAIGKANDYLSDFTANFDKNMGKVEAKAAPVIAFLAPAFADLGNTVRTNVLPNMAKFAQSDLWRVLGGTAVVAIRAAVVALNQLTMVGGEAFGFLAQQKGALLGLGAGILTYTVVVGGVTKATQAWAAAQAALKAVMSMSTLGIVGLLAGAVAGITVAYINSTNATNSSGSATERLSALRDRLTQATRTAKDAEDALKGAQLDQEGASLRVEAAQAQLKAMTDQYGASSYQARQASYDLKLAMNDLSTANQSVTDKTNGTVAALKNVVAIKEEIKKANNEVGGSAAAAANGYASLKDQVNAYTTAIKNNNQAAANKVQVNAFKINTVGKNANGANNWSGGPTWVGERGPELIDLPAGSKVTTNQESMKKAGGGGNNYFPNAQFYFGSADAVSQWFKEANQNSLNASKGMAF